jgi:hypothetical protein
MLQPRLQAYLAATFPYPGRIRGVQVLDVIHLQSNVYDEDIFQDVATSLGAKRGSAEPRLVFLRICEDQWETAATEDEPEAPTVEVLAGRINHGSIQTSSFLFVAKSPIQSSYTGYSAVLELIQGFVADADSPDVDCIQPADDYHILVKDPKQLIVRAYVRWQVEAPSHQNEST